MSSFFSLTLDTAPPANGTVLLNGGAVKTGSRRVFAEVRTSDFEDGARDVTWMKIWGDVDPTFDPRVQPNEADSDWLAYDTVREVQLSPGVGRKTVYSALRDDVCNVSLPFSDFIDLDETTPVVDITTAVDRSRISTTPPCDRAVFAWKANRPFEAYVVRVVPSLGSPSIAGAPVPDTYGSSNVEGIGLWEAEEVMVTEIVGLDLQTASPGDTTKTIKVFVRDVGGQWSA